MTQCSVIGVVNLDHVEQSLRSGSLQPLVQRMPETAIVHIFGITESQNGVAQLIKFWLRTHDRVDKACGHVGCIALTGCADQKQGTPGSLQAIRIQILQ